MRLKFGTDAHICGMARTPFGKFFGAFRTTDVAQLGATAIKALLDEEGVGPEDVDLVVMGHVLSAGAGQHPARQAALLAGVAPSVPAVNINKVCASSLAALEYAAERILIGEADVAIAGGMENMTRAPYLIKRWEESVGTVYRVPFREAMEKMTFPVRIIDSLLSDGLAHPYLLDYLEPHMGRLADEAAAAHGVSRADQEAYAAESIRRAEAADAAGHFAPEPALATAPPRLLQKDETLRPLDLERMRALAPAFAPNGTVTAATSSPIADGAVALLLAGEDALGDFEPLLQPLARIVACAHFSHDAKGFVTAPVGAIRALLLKTRLELGDIDFFEVNEAFAVVPIYAMRSLGIPFEKTNVWGGAIALGHPLGASGARIAGNVALQLTHYERQFGIAVACNGCGEAVAVLLEQSGYADE